MATTASWVGGGSAAGSSITATMLNRAGLGMGQAPTGHAEHKSSEYNKGGLGMGRTHTMNNAGSSSSSFSNFRNTIGVPMGSTTAGGVSHSASFAGGGAGGGRPMYHISERQKRAMEDQALGNTVLLY